MKIRLDQAVANRLNISRNKAQNLIKEGLVFVGETAILKPSFEVGGAENITIKNHDNYVSRGAYKLIKGLDEFGISVGGKTVLDMGASTGGFTEVLLERGAKKVYSVDVGKGELDESLQNDKRVVNMEGRDIRVLTKEEIGDAEFVVGDLSFISLQKILPHIKSIFGKIQMVLLFKPQFECGKDTAKKFKGIIKDKVIHKKLLKEFADYLNVLGFSFSNLTFSPIKGGSGNIEYLVYLNGETKEKFNIENVVETAFNLL